MARVSFSFSGFDDLRDGRVYQAWVIPQGGTPRDRSQRQRQRTLTLEGDIRGTKVAVTLEPGPGAKAPSIRPFADRGGARMTQDAAPLERRAGSPGRRAVKAAP